MTIIDWQIVLSGPGAFDLIYFLTQSMTIADRRAAAPDIIKAYAERLESLGAKFDRAEFDRLTKAVCLACLAYPIHNSPTMDDGPARTRQLVTVMFDRACAAIEDYEVLDIIG